MSSKDKDKGQPKPKKGGKKKVALTWSPKTTPVLGSILIKARRGSSDGIILRPIKESMPLSWYTDLGRIALSTCTQKADDGGVHEDGVSDEFAKGCIAFLEGGEGALQVSEW